MGSIWFCEGGRGLFGPRGFGPRGTSVRWDFFQGGSGPGGLMSYTLRFHSDVMQHDCMTHADGMVH